MTEPDGPKPSKRSIALVVRNGERILTIRRQDDDDELPGIWGLPAGSFRGQETTQDLAGRIGRDKLGVRVVAGRRLTSGKQDRPAYSIEMDLIEAALDGEPTHPEWKWDSVEVLRDGAGKGSLCCALALETLERPEERTDN